MSYDRILLCTALNQCSTEPPVCSQVCMSDQSSGGHQCSCVSGYQLASDRRRCVVASRRWQTWKFTSALLFYTQSGRVISKSVKTGDAGKLVHRATGLASALGLLSTAFVEFSFSFFIAASRQDALQACVQCTGLSTGCPPPSKKTRTFPFA